MPIKPEKPKKPTALQALPEAVPAELRILERWVVWRYRWEANKDGGGKWKKPPFYPVSGRACKVTEPDAGCNFADALTAYESGRYDGIGLVMHAEPHPKTGRKLYCLDIDDCIGAEYRAPDEEAARIIGKLGSYTELSPSGAGVHVWFWGELGDAGRRVGGYELYAAARYMTVTGHTLPGAPPDIRDPGEAAFSVCFELGLVDSPRQPSAASAPSPAMPYQEVIDRCSKGLKGVRFTKLLAGLDCDYESTSHADMAFCATLAFYTQDAAQMEAIWRQSGRWREKCDKHKTYVRDTIKKALETARTYYDPKFPSGKPPAPPQTAPPPPVLVIPPARQKPEHVASRRVLDLSEIGEHDTTWLVPGWVPRAELSLVVGPATSGKSTFAAWLAAQARSVLFLPGSEENIRGPFRKRLAALCPPGVRIGVLDGLDWTLPSNAKHIEEQVLARAADLLILDPIDSYMDDGLGENNAQSVRPMLESLVGIAHRTGAAVVAIRHPGKLAGNICPGSRAWRAVPRIILELVLGIEIPPTRFLHLDKDSLGARTPDTYYALEDQGEGKPCRFVLKGPVARATAEVARSITDRLERKKVDVACDLIRQLLSDGEQEAGWVLREGQGLGLPPSTMYLAADRMGVVKRAEGGGKSAKHWWGPPKSWPEDAGETNTGGGGVGVS